MTCALNKTTGLRFTNHVVGTTTNKPVKLTVRGFIKADNLYFKLTPKHDDWTIVEVSKPYDGNVDVTIQVGSTQSSTLTVSEEVNGKIDKDEAIVIGTTTGVDSELLAEFMEKVNYDYEQVKRQRHQGQHIEETIERMWQHVREMYQIVYTLAETTEGLTQSQGELINTINQSLGAIVTEMFQDWAVCFEADFWHKWETVYYPKLDKQLKDAIKAMNDLADNRFKEQDAKIEANNKSQLGVSETNNKAQNKKIDDAKKEQDKLIADMQKDITERFLAQDKKIEEYIAENEALTKGIPFIDNVVNHKYTVGAWDVNNNLHFVNELTSVKPGAIQGAHINQYNGEWFTVTSAVIEKQESLIITRNDASGNILDSMVVIGGGHGYSTHILQSGGRQSVAFLAVTSTTGVKPLIKFPYRPNTTINITDSAVENIELPNGILADWVVIEQPRKRRGDLASHMYVLANGKLHSFSVTIKYTGEITFTGDNKEIPIKLPPNRDTNTHQGFQVLPGKTVSGSPSDKTHIIAFQVGAGHDAPGYANAGLYLYKYDREAGTIEDFPRINYIDLVGNTEGRPEGIFSSFEPEGLIDLSSPAGNGELLYGGLGMVFSTGTPGVRKQMIFALANPAVTTRLNTFRNQGENSKSLNSALNYSSEYMYKITVPGDYTIGAGAFTAFKDTPYMHRGDGSGQGWILNVTKHSTLNRFNQTLTKMTGGQIIKFTRTINYDYVQATAVSEKGVGMWSMEMTAMTNQYRPNGIKHTGLLSYPGMQWYLTAAEAESMDAGLKGRAGFLTNSQCTTTERSEGIEFLQTYHALDGHYQFRTVLIKQDKWGIGGEFVSSGKWRTVRLTEE